VHPIMQQKDLQLITKTASECSSLCILLFFNYLQLYLNYIISCFSYFVSVDWVVPLLRFQVESSTELVCIINFPFKTILSKHCM